jgi:hypothetical protein
MAQSSLTNRNRSCSKYQAQLARSSFKQRMVQVANKHKTVQQHQRDVVDDDDQAQLAKLQASHTSNVP